MIKYTVTNQSQKTHRLEMIPITGITPSGCSSNLGYQESCVLTLEVDGSALTSSINGGPILCHKDNLNQCYQPGRTNALHITFTKKPPIITYTVTPSGDAHVVITPNTPKVVNAGSTQQFTVIHITGYSVNSAVAGTCGTGLWTGTTYTTGVVELTIAPNYTAAIASDTCGGSLVGTTYTTGAVTSNCSVSFSGTPIPTTLSVNGSPLLLTPNTTGSLVVTNTGSFPALDVMATLPPALAADVNQDASHCASLAAGASCNLHFSVNNQSHPPTAIPIAGINTNTEGATLTLTLPYVADGQVNAVLFDSINNRIYLGGAFSVVGPNTGSGIPISTVTGLPDMTFPRVNGDVNAVVSDGIGGWYIGGAFTNLGGVTRNRIAHILSDGTVDPNWNPNANAAVSSLAVNGSIVYAGGSFTAINDLAVPFFSIIPMDLTP